MCLVTLLAAGAPAVSEEIREAVPVGPSHPEPTPEPIDTGDAEDGTPYLTDHASLGSPARSGWSLGKIEPAVEAAAAVAPTVDVILYLLAPDALPEGVPTVGEVKDRYRPALEALGGRIREMVGSTRPDLPLTEELERFWAWAEPPLSDAEQAELTGLRLELDATFDAMRHDVASAVQRRAEASFAGIREAVIDAGGTINDEVALTLALAATIPSHELVYLAEREDVHAVMLDQPLELELDVSIPTLEVDTWWTAGFDGGIWDGGLVDSGVQQNHPAFSSVAFYTDAATPTDSDGHGTHVAGIMASGNVTYSGVAPGLESFIWGTAGATQSGTMARMETLVSGYIQSPEVVNHSLGYGTANTSDYNANDTFYDAYIEAYDILVSKSAGNESWGATLPTITHPAPAYNLLTVANMNDLGTVIRTDDVRSGSSSTGPTLNGRLKPDIAAPGSVIRSTNAFWVGAGSGTPIGCRDPNVHWDFVDCSGTSMAAPHVAGMVVLMEDAGNNNPIAQKAVLLNTADAWTSNNTSSTADDGPVAGSHWDKSYGWGYLDAWEAHYNRTDVVVTNLVPRNDTANEDDYKLFVGTMYQYEKATMVWEKRGVYAAGAPASTTYALADLNLRLYDEATGTLADSDLSGPDNVHQVAASTNMTAVIKPYSWSTSFAGGFATQAVALATEEGFVEAEFPSTFQGQGWWPVTVQPSEQLSYEMWVRNDSVLAAHANQLEVQLPAGWSIVSGANPQNVGTVAGSGSTSNHAVWTLQAQATPQLDVPVPFTHSHSSYDESYGPFTWNLTIDVVQDLTPPSPDPMTWFALPQAVSSSQIGMTATVATDPHGPVEYFFDFTSSPTGGAGGSDSSYQTSTFYQDSGLGPNHQYCYRVRARDNPTTTPNTTGFSTTSCAVTLANQPGTGSVVPVGGGALLVSWGANGNPGWTQYLVENTTNGRLSGWTTATSWTDQNLICGTYSYRVKARNASGVETSWTGLGSGTPATPGAVFCDGFSSGGLGSWSASMP